jgi:hypothetical protein
MSEVARYCENSPPKSKKRPKKGRFFGGGIHKIVVNALN